MADFRLFGRVDVEANDAVQQLDRLESEVAQANAAFREQASAAAAAGRALDKLKADTMANAEAVAAARRELVAAEQAQLKMAAAAKAAQQALRDHQVATGQMAQSAGAARAAMTNLGQQIGDVTMGLSMGVNPATIFAQQAGQIAFAVQGMGGALSGVGRFLGGPWGIALTTALVALSPFIGKLFEADGAARVARDGSISFASEVGIAFKGLAAAAADALEPLGRMFAAAVAEMRKHLPAFQDVVAGALGALDTLNGWGASTIGTKRTDWAGQYRTYRAGEVQKMRSQDQLDQQTTQWDLFNRGALGKSFVDGLERWSDEAPARAKQAADKAKDEARKLADENKRLTDSYNPVLAAQNAYRSALDEIEKAEQRGIVTATLAGKARASAAQDLRTALIKASAEDRVPLSADIRYGQALPTPALAGLGDASALVDAVAAAPVPDMAKRWGGDIAREFAGSAAGLADEIGVSLAGGFGRGLRTASGVAAFLERLQPGQGNAFMDSFESTIRDGFNAAFQQLQRGFKAIFGKDSDLGAMLGKAAGGAAIGGVVANITGLGSTGAQIGGAIGASLEKPLGKALNGIFKGLGDFAGPIGSIAGALLGGLFKGKNPYADARISTSSTGVEASIYNQRGDGSAQTGLGIAGAVSQQLSKIANALGADIRSGLALGSIGFSGKDYYFNASGGDYKGPGAQKFGSADEAVAAAVANALASNAITSSPKVQAALARYAGNVNLAVSEALKVKSVEDLLDSSANPFSAVMKAFERQAAQRLQVARDYGLDVLAVEKVNAEQRKQLIEQTLEQSIGSAKALLDELQFGSRATGSFGERRAALMTERDRLLGLANAGDNEAAQKLTDVLQQLLDVSSAGYGATDVFAADRSSSMNILQQLVAQRQAQIEAAATAAKTPDPQLAEANASLDDLVGISQRMAASLEDVAARLGSTGATVSLSDLYMRASA